LDIFAIGHPLSQRTAPRLFFLLVAFLAFFASAQADMAWRRVRAVDLHALFVDHELADGIHYAYQLRGDGTFTGFSMGKAARGTWRIADGEFCWTQKRRAAEEECFEVQRSGDSVRLLRHGYEALAAKLSPVKLKPELEAPR